MLYGTCQPSILGHGVEHGPGGEVQPTLWRATTVATLATRLDHRLDGPGIGHIQRIARSILAPVVLRPLLDPLPDEGDLVRCERRLGRARHDIVRIVLVYRFPK